MSGTLSCLNSRKRGLGELAAEIRTCHRSHLRELWLEVVPGSVVIRGVATSYYGKQLALHEVRRRCDLPVTANQIVVVAAVPKTVPIRPLWRLTMTRDPNDVVRAYAGPLVLVEVYQTALAEAGIECRVVGTELAGSFGSALPESVELWVHRIDLPRAKDVIDRESRPEDRKSHDRPHHHFPHPIDDPKPAPPPHRREPYVNPDPGA